MADNPPPTNADASLVALGPTLHEGQGAMTADVGLVTETAGDREAARGEADGNGRGACDRRHCAIGAARGAGARSSGERGGPGRVSDHQDPGARVGGSEVKNAAEADELVERS
jgi:hypothetical protein